MNNWQQPLDRRVLRRAPTIAARLACVALMLAVAITGCASLRLDPVITDSVKVEHMDSPRAVVATVQVRDHDGRLKVSGRLKKRHKGRSAIPGHLHIEALGQDGAMLGQVTARYRQLSPKMGLSEFSRVLDINPEQVRTVRVIHHYRDDDEGAGNASPVPAASCGTHGQLQSV